MYKYKKIEHTADLAFEIKSDSLEELFEAAFLCWQSALFDEIPKGKAFRKEFNFLGESMESLLVDFLNYCNYLLFGKGMIAKRVKKIKIKQYEKFVLNVDVDIVELSEGGEGIKLEIKAVTYHQLSVIQTKGQFVTKLVFDV